MQKCNTEGCKNTIIVRGSNLCLQCYTNRIDESKGNSSKRTISHEEDNIQEAFFNTARMMFPKLDKLLFAVPNGGKRDKREAARMKKQGVVSGVSDILLLIPNEHYPYLAMECKTDKGISSEHQIQFKQQVEKTGGKYVIFRSAFEGIEIIKEYLKTSSYKN